MHGTWPPPPEASFERSAGKGWPRKARKPALLPTSDGDAGVQAYIASMEPWQAASAKRVDALVVKHVPSMPAPRICCHDGRD